MTLLLFIMCLIVGLLCGMTGVGGILLIPVVQYCTGMTISEAAATSLASFCLTAIVGWFLHFRAKTLNSKHILPLCGGAVAFSFLGSLSKAVISNEALTIIFALLVIFAGFAALKTARPLINFNTSQKESHYLVFVGCFVGFMVGLTGAGGPVLSIPMMLVAGVSPLACIAASQPLQFVAAFFGTVANVILDLVDWEIMLYIFIIQSAGVWTGIWIARRVNASKLKIAIAVMCVITGVYMLLR